MRRDIERFLRDPGRVLRELEDQLLDEEAGESGSSPRDVEQEIARLDDQYRLLLDLYLDRRFDKPELDRRADQLAARRRELESESEALRRSREDRQTLPDRNLLAEYRAKLDAGLDDEQWQLVAGLLVDRIDVHTTLCSDGSKEAKLVIHYNFPSVVATDTGTGSWRQRGAPCGPIHGRLKVDLAPNRPS